MALLSLDKIGFGSTEIFHYIHTRTNVAWTNVAWTNVDVTNVPKAVDNSNRWPKNQAFRVWLSYDQ